jgi:hypothetical protein
LPTLLILKVAIILNLIRKSYDSNLENNANEFDRNKKEPKNSFVPLYRKAFGGIIIYDIEAEIPDQPIPKPLKVKF